MAIGAHPDDIEFGCGATLAKWAAAGATIHHLVLTDGAKGTWDPRRDAAALVARRQQEQRRAAALLGGGDVIFLGRTDGELRNGVRRAVGGLSVDSSHSVPMSCSGTTRGGATASIPTTGTLDSSSPTPLSPHAIRTSSLIRDWHPTAHRLCSCGRRMSRIMSKTSADFAETKIAALLAHESQFASTMGIEDAGSAQVDAFTRRVHTQLSEHGALAGSPRARASTCDRHLGLAIAKSGARRPPTSLAPRRKLLTATC